MDSLPLSHLEVHKDSEYRVKIFDKTINIILKKEASVLLTKYTVDLQIMKYLTLSVISPAVPEEEKKKMLRSATSAFLHYSTAACMKAWR